MYFQMRGREPPFIGGEEGVIWKRPHPLMEGANWPQDPLNLARHLCNRHCNVGGKLLAKNGAERGRLGCGRTCGLATTPLSPNMPIFGEWAPLGFLTWPMVVFYEDKVVWLEFGLVLLIFEPWFAWRLGHFSLGLSRMIFILCSFPFYCVFPQMPSYKW